MAAAKRSTTTGRKAATTPVVVAPVTTTSHPRTCGQLFELMHDEAISASACKRLPRHHGDHVMAKPRGLMTMAERKALDLRRSKSRVSKKVVKIASKIVTVGGTKFRVFANGRAEPVTSEPAPTKSAPAAKRRVRVIPSADSKRRVAAPAKIARRSPTAKPSCRPSAHLA